ncbi:uncharacterized protein XM38_037530 [Halomicronema hongdechloris C2206]|uniref:PsbP C-terminal domain-containing protein n=1 Tax=Halomicronema hongdechloris C2206 TaxID=1641165 RepID=A0A1Z3HR49_9CYAN|nr:hypothetical protein [Halomicronema hongdechloris]ASC72794.1 uncharacterized protein XM38_037530 [Halomicronema hongdechloris C2206]
MGVLAAARRWLIVALLSPVVVGCASDWNIAWPGSGGDNEVPPATGTQTLTTLSEDWQQLRDGQGRLQIKVPTGWQPDARLHDSAELEAGNPEQEAYVIVLSEAISAVSYSGLEDNALTYKRAIVNGLDSQPEREVKTSVSLESGLSGVQYEIHGEYRDQSLVYLHTTVVSDTHYYQIVAWSAADRFEENQETLQDIIQSFQES